MVVAPPLIGTTLWSSLKSSADGLLTESGLSIAAKTPLTAVNVEKEVPMSYTEALATTIHSATNCTKSYHNSRKLNFRDRKDSEHSAENFHGTLIKPII